MSKENYKDLIEDLCKQLEGSLDVESIATNSYEKHAVLFELYHLSHGGGFVVTARIVVDKIRTFIETIYYEVPTEKEINEIKVLQRLLSATFCYGIMSAKKILDDKLIIP